MTSSDEDLRRMRRPAGKDSSVGTLSQHTQSAAVPGKRTLTEQLPAVSSTTQKTPDEYVRGYFVVLETGREKLALLVDANRTRNADDSARFGSRVQWASGYLAALAKNRSPVSDPVLRAACSDPTLFDAIEAFRTEAELHLAEAFVPPKDPANYVAARQAWCTRTPSANGPSTATNAAETSSSIPDMPGSFGATSTRDDDPVGIATHGVAGASEPLPHVDELQPLFGRHDLSHIKARTGGPAADAARALGAEAYAIGDHVGFASAPSLHTAAHEAAHVIQGQAGVARKAAIDAGNSDPGETHADAVADAVVRGEDVQAQLDGAGSPAGSGAAVHRKRDGESSAPEKPSALSRFLFIHEAGLRTALVTFFADAGWPDPAPDVRFARGGEQRFSATIVRGITAVLTDEHALGRLVSPGDVHERFHKYVDLKKPNDSRLFGQALAQLVQWAARDALVERVGPRYRTLWASRFATPDADELIGVHAMDALVARALTPDGVVDISEMPAAESPAPATSDAPKRKASRSHNAGHTADSRAGDAHDAGAPTVEQLMEIERGIGVKLDTIRDQVARFDELSWELREAFEVRAKRVALLADADAATRTRYLPVLQFQHAQLITISRPLSDVVTRYWPLRMPDMVLTEDKRAERDRLKELLTTFVRAAACSHDKAKSAAILRQPEQRERQKMRDQIDAQQIAADADTRQMVESTPYNSPTGTAQGLEALATQRQAMVDGTAKGRSRYEHQKALTLGGEVSLNARIESAEHALTQLRAAAINVYGDVEGLHRAFPKLRPLPLVIQDVTERLADVRRTWDAAIRDGTPVVQEDPHAPDDWADWRARSDALPIAQKAFAKISGNQDLSSFLNDAAKEIRHQAIVNAVVQLAVALLITIGTGMGAAALGARAAAALATEGSGLFLRGVAFAADLSINVTINTAVQLAISQPTRRRKRDEHGNEVEESDGAIIGSMLLENLLMDGFTRALASPLHKAQDLALKEAREIATMPHLSGPERKALTSFSFAGTQMSVELIGGMAAQNAAHQLVQHVHKTDEEVSEPFALTVLQQGAAIALGKFFHAQLDAWKRHREALAKTRFGGSADAHALFAAREAFYARSKELSESLSPDPAAMNELVRLNESLLQQERALVASHGDEATQRSDDGAGAQRTHDRVHSEESNLRPHPVADTQAPITHAQSAHDAQGSAASHIQADAEPTHLGERIASLVGARYVGDGTFVIGSARGPIPVEVRRRSRLAVRHHGDGIILEVPRGTAEPELERAIAGKLAELAHQEVEQAIGHTGHEPELSAHDHGLIAELRVLRRQEIEAHGRGVEATQQQAQIRAQIQAVEKRLGVDARDATGAQRKRMVETQLRVQEGATARAEEARQLAGDRGHPGIEVHSHFMGIVAADVFRQRAATVGGNEDAGSWLPLFERIRTMHEAEKLKWKNDHPGAHESDFESTLRHKRKAGRIEKRSNTGDAMNVIDLAYRQIVALQRRASDPSPGISAADRAAFMRAAEYVAEEASRTALSSTPETPFDGSYVLRDALVTTTFGGQRTPGDYHHDAAVEQRAFDDYIREALLRLAAEGIHYSEQSTGIKKLAGQLHPDRIERVLQQLIAEGKIRPGQIDIKMLGMLKTSHFGERDPNLPPVGRQDPARAAHDRDAGKALRQVERGDALGIDIGAPELMSFTTEGMRRWQAQLVELSNFGKATGEAQLSRPHVGEGAMDTKEGMPFHTDKNRHIVGDEPSHYPRARHNIEMMLDALESLPPGVLDPKYLLVRFGHAAHARPAQAARMKRLGVIAEANLGSNIVTGSISQTQGVHGKRAATDRFDDHSFPTLIYYDAAILLSTDGPEVMNTKLDKEYARARLILEAVLAGNLPVRISATDATVDGKVRGHEVAGRPDEREIRVWEMTSDEIGRFERGYKKLYDDAERYYRSRPKGNHGQALDLSAYTRIATEHGLVPRFGHASFEGRRTSIDAAVAAYRAEGYRVSHSDAGDGALTVVIAPDDQATLTLATVEEQKR